jgi:hypothetical protein
VTPNFKKNIGQRLRKEEKMTEENKYINSWRISDSKHSETW